MFKQNEKSIAQIAEYIPRACRDMQLQEAKARLEKKIIDVTEGRRTRSILILDSGHLVLSSVQPDTISQRLATLSREERNPALKLDRLENSEA